MSPITNVRMAYQQSTTFLAAGTTFVQDNFSIDREDGLGMTEVYYIHCALYFYYCYISSTSDHQTLDPGGWEPPAYIMNFCTKY